jgi:hypothetical protein
VPAEEESGAEVNAVLAACIRISRKSTRQGRPTIKDATVDSAQNSAISLEKQKLQIVQYVLQQVTSEKILAVHFVVMFLKDLEYNEFIGS